MTKNKENKEFDIIRRIIEGETELFKFLVDNYKGKSLSIAYSIIKDYEEAQDVLQETFIKIYRNLYKFEFRSSFSTWLYRIVVNSSYTALKRSRNKKTSSFDKTTLDISSDLDSFDLLQENERKKVINKVLDSLKPNEALVLRLFYLGEQSINEISEITEISLSNVKVLLFRARAKFHVNLEKLLGQDKKHLL